MARRTERGRHNQGQLRHLRARLSRPPPLGHLDLDQLSPEHLDSLYRHLEESGKRNGSCRTAGVTCDENDCSPDRHDGLSSKSVRHVHTAIRRALQVAAERGRVLRNVADLAHPPTKRQSRSTAARDNVWTGDQLRAWLASLEGDRLYPTALLLATTGLRRGELLGLCWRDLGLDEPELSVRQTITTANGRAVRRPAAKTDAGGRTLSLDPTTAEAFRAHRRRQAEELMALGVPDRAGVPDGAVFLQESGEPVMPDWFSRWFATTCEQADVSRIGVHGVRDNYATTALRSGVDVDVLSARLGHSSPSVTLDIYSHVLGGDDQQAANTAARSILGVDCPADPALGS